MKNTLENKAKFFAQYWGQNVALNEYYKNNGCGCFMAVPQDAKDGNIYLELKPLSSISDEDVRYLEFDFEDDFNNYIFRIFPDSYTHYVVYRNNLKQIEGNLKLSHFDYLRSKGYALDWNGITVEEQIEFGWIKLKNS